jgi:hypothetical protein
MLRALGVALLALPLPMGPAADGGCSGQSVSLEGFAPLSTTDSRTFTVDAFTCFVLAATPQFGFHGHLHGELSDSEGHVALVDAECLANLPPVMGCAFSGTAEDLAPGAWTLHAAASDGVLPVGSWVVAVTYG